ncbi:ABC-type Co2+ transport system, periplasmic component [uncultured Alphaproteobacteria bacterium]|uniref:ABC-type Co2+ transport system, periplasmic component n=1 Tax=uncultured Alphaproteobacteria bacterium TaxID=91750 RepID=A0A212K582_9PROT|nr:ABC-type Co2+ transport system, periplasmic component [uncultured Alphaproteobacteria bacterium]
MRFAVRPLLAAAAVLLPTAAFAHFQEILPSTDIVPETGDRSVTLDLVFTHPFEGGPMMEMASPARFGVRAHGKTTDLSASLVRRPVDGKSAWRAAYRVSEPGDYVFYVEPKPYWEPAERKFIVHYAKVVVDFASGDGWDDPVGLPVEIAPLVRPYGLWTGNQFRGVVLRDGKPVPFAEIEVEWVNDDTVKAPADPFVTQVIKADAAGTFSYTMPRAGWWGFAALVDGDAPMTAPDGKPADVELGGLIWVKTVDMK